jgi:hypothetical protein
MPEDFSERSITEFREADLVDRVFDNPKLRLAIGLPPLASLDWLHRLAVQLPPDTRGRQRGDIDILAIPPSSPEQSVAIEVKCVRVSASAFWTNEPNGLGNWPEGIAQANRLAERGFHQVYLYLFASVDSRTNNEGRLSYAGATPQLRERIRSSLQLGRLNPRIGMVENYFTQPIDEPAFEIGTSQMEIIKMAEAIEQPEAVTQWVAEQFSLSGL